MLDLLFIEKVTENQDAFAAKVIDISSKLGINPNWLMLTMFLESGLNSRRINGIGAIGLIQFLPSTYRDTWGLTADDLLNISNVDQLDYVYKFYEPAAGKLKSYVDLHIFAFWPIAVIANKPDSYIFQLDTLPADVVARQNAPIDINKDNQITKGEAKQYYFKDVKNSIQSGLIPKQYKSQFMNSKIIEIAKITAILLIAFVLIYSSIQNLQNS